ncbi:Uncharacterised protein [Yersinia kristensenii]|nr:hypothetical protein DJ57_4054 [Yersinia rochesterensis]CRY67102.1 Uncharacterised protein [Yersinia kristensenii]
MSGIGDRHPALLDGGQHRLTTGCHRRAVDHQIQIVDITGDVIAVDQLQHDVAPILREDRQVGCDDRVGVLPVARAGDTDRAAVQRQFGHVDHSIGL